VGVSPYTASIPSRLDLVDLITFNWYALDLVDLITFNWYALIHHI
jgi:hypothetical protein